MSVLSDALHKIKFSVPHYTIKGWGKDGSDIDAMRIVVREDLTLEIMQKTMNVIVDVWKYDQQIEQPSEQTQTVKEN
ncbi:hypothetical protein N7481_007462 [Penicillium waksmanii]|uniref:uncharacterized protein n=1 Tax=Penicillium waksmanii TaxID=69791 RepID=UPI00254902D1|nr:uncharacterized protein N7481_007462 [Penicillium waksmanii]KAJ5980164.1 hypothetical protein N7481_007462 [Penicillium waksmanii]